MKKHRHVRGHADYPGGDCQAEEVRTRRGYRMGSNAGQVQPRRLAATAAAAVAAATATVQ